MMVADGAEIAAQLPYLKRLIHGYHARQVFTRRIHLIWQISDMGGYNCLFAFGCADKLRCWHRDRTVSE